MENEGQYRQRPSGRSRITAVVEITGREGRVLEEGTRLVRMIVDELDRSRLVSLRLEYDPAAESDRIVAAGTDILDIVTPTADSSEEATFWGLVLRAGVVSTA